MTPSDDTTAWFEKSAEDEEMIRRALNIPPKLPSGAAYHAQQAAEKALKGFLVAHNVRPDFTHDLTALVGRLRQLAPRTSVRLYWACYYLNHYDTISRYPSHVRVTLQDAQAAAKRARHICGVLRRILDVTE